MEGLSYVIQLRVSNVGGQNLDLDVGPFSAHWLIEIITYFY